LVFSTGEGLRWALPEPGGPWSSISDGQSGLLEPHLDGPGLAIELYPDELRFDSEALWSPRAPIENGLRYDMPPGATPRCPAALLAGDIDSASDSASLRLHVMVIIGGTQGRSKEFGLSGSLYSLRFCFGSGNWNDGSCRRDLWGGGEPGNSCEGVLECVGEGVWMVSIGMTRGCDWEGFEFDPHCWPSGGGRFCNK
jgi:hypothetical protein